MEKNNNSLVSSVQEAIKQDASFNAQDIEVSGQDGTILLKGSIEDQELADKLVQIVRKVQGVNDVKTELDFKDGSARQKHNYEQNLSVEARVRENQSTQSDARKQAMNVGSPGIEGSDARDTNISGTPKSQCDATRREMR